MDPTAAETYVDEQFETFLGDLRAFVAQPSISATGEGIAACADSLRSRCLEYGFDAAEVVGTAGHPAVIAHAYVDNDPDNDAPTVLVYGHYDVQPVEADRWSTPPFEPTVRTVDGERMLYGRGTVDNKGQHFAYLAAVRALRETIGLPVNVTMLLDGEEERGSPNLMDAIEARADALAADVAINSDGPIDDSGRPTVVLGNRGILVIRIAVRGPEGDLHSGHYGGAIPNPVWALTRLLGTMKDDTGRIAVDGFYDDVRPIPDADRPFLDELAPDPERLTAELGVGGFEDGPGETFLEKTLYYPTLNVNGIAGGHTAEGFKTIVPSEAWATIDMRLVVDQDPDDIFRKVAAHVDDHADDRVETTVTKEATLDPMRTPTDTPFLDPVVAAVTEGWGAEPLVKPSTGGSAPYAQFTSYLDVPLISVPYGQPDNNQHSPDEHFALSHFRKGIRTSVRVLAALGDVM